MLIPSIISLDGKRVRYTLEEAKSLPLKSRVLYAGEAYEILVRMPTSTDIFFTLRKVPLQKGSMINRISYIDLMYSDPTKKSSHT